MLVRERPVLQGQATVPLDRIGACLKTILFPFDRGDAKDAIKNSAGCAVLISCDRRFLDRLAMHILAFEGNVEADDEERQRKLGDAAGRPTRLAHKKLTR